MAFSDNSERASVLTLIAHIRILHKNFDMPFLQMYRLLDPPHFGGSYNLHARIYLKISVHLVNKMYRLLGPPTSYEFRLEYANIG